MPVNQYYINIINYGTNKKFKPGFFGHLLTKIKMITLYTSMIQITRYLRGNFDHVSYMEYFCLKIYPKQEFKTQYDTILPYILTNVRMFHGYFFGTNLTCYHTYNNKCIVYFY